MTLPMQSSGMRISTDMDRLEQAGPGRHERFFESEIAGDLERDVLRIHRMHFAVVEIDLDIDDSITGENPFFGRLHDALLDRGHKNAIDVLAGQRSG